LHQAVGEGRITTAEHLERTDAARASKTYDDLFKLTADLIPQPSTARQPARPVRYRELPPVELEPINAVLCEVDRAGPYRIRSYTRISAFMGTVSLDLSEATFDTAVAEFDLTPTMSNVKITVPRGLGVRDETTKSLSDVNARSLARQAQPGQPTLVLRGALALSQLRLRVSR
jgi:hypothetical protein